jgi:hypothetical protein
MIERLLPARPIRNDESTRRERREGGSWSPGSTGRDEARAPILLCVPYSSGGVTVVLGVGLPTSCGPRLPLPASSFDAEVAAL